MNNEMFAVKKLLQKNTHIIKSFFSIALVSEIVSLIIELSVVSFIQGVSISNATKFPLPHLLVGVIENHLE